MRVKRQVRDGNHDRIVDGASRLLRERGIAGTSVADVMQEAGLTHGGFYRHFGSKDALVLAAIDVAFDQLLAAVEAEPGAEAVRRMQTRYLADAHVQQASVGCPMPALAADVSRASPSVKDAFGRQVGRVIDHFATGAAEAPAEDARTAAAQRLAMLVGAVVLARACDDATARRLLRACRAALASNDRKRGLQP